MLPGSARPPRPTLRTRARAYLPLAGAVAVVAIVGGALSATAGDQGKGGEVEAVDVVPAISFSRAQAEGLDVTFPETCDTETGRVAIPFVLAPECYSSFEDNGGRTARGVTGDTVNVVLYLPDPADPILDLLAGPLGLDVSPDAIDATYRGYGELFEANYQTYGRRARFEVLHASGFSNDEVAA
ncbi:MAG: hypothetical protein ACRD0U_14970, partial [Acidimicrobiales bacterium]